MGLLTSAIYESFNIEEDFAEEVAETADKSVEENKEEENLDENLNEAAGNTIWDKIAPALQESLNESSDIGKAIDEYQELLRQDIPPAKAKAIVTGEEEEIQESLKESKENKPNKYDPKAYMQKVVERYKKEAKFPLDEQLTEEKLKNEGWRIKNVAMKAAVPSAALREALLEGTKNED